MRNADIILAGLASFEKQFLKKPPRIYPDHVRPEVRAAWDSRIDPTIANPTRQQRRWAERKGAQ